VKIAYHERAIKITYGVSISSFQELKARDHLVGATLER
jgi:hypothetical protein